MPPVIATATGRATLFLLVLGFARVFGFVRRRWRSALGVAGTGLLGSLRVGLDALVELVALLGRDLAGVLRGLGRGLAAGSLGEDVFRQGELRTPLDRLRVVCSCDNPPALDTLERERQSASLAVDLDDLRLDLIPLRDDLARVLDVMLGELGDMHEPFDAGEDLDEGAERDDLRNLAVDLVSLVVGIDDLLPWIRLGLLQPERDPLALTVDVEDLHLHVLADLEHLGRMVDVAPRKLGDVNQAVHAVEVDESAEVDDVRDLAVDDVAGVEPVENLLPLLLALVLEHRAAGEDDVVSRAVELDHLGA